MRILLAVMVPGLLALVACEPTSAPQVDASAPEREPPCRDELYDIGTWGYSTVHCRVGSTLHVDNTGRWASCICPKGGLQ